MRFKRYPLPASVSRAIRGERDGGPPMRPDDLAWSDVGPCGSSDGTISNRTTPDGSLTATSGRGEGGGLMNERTVMTNPKPAPDTRDKQAGVSAADECVLRNLYDVIALSWLYLRRLDVDDADDRPEIATHLARLCAPRTRVLLREAAAVLDRLGVPVRVPEP
jgi:hypothetical protein